MDSKTINKHLSYTALAAALALLAMLMVSLLDPLHHTQQQFEFLEDPVSYSNSLLSAAANLRVILTLDYIFIACYLAAFVFLFMALQTKEKLVLLIIALCAIIGTAVLDLYENHRILVFLTLAEKDKPITTEAIANQMVWSQLKFHLSYLSFFLFSFAMPLDTVLEKFLRFGLLFLQLPIGVLVYTVPENLKPFFEIGRYAFMLGGLFLLAYNFQPKRRTATFLP